MSASTHRAILLWLFWGVLTVSIAAAVFIVLYRGWPPFAPAQPTARPTQVVLVSTQSIVIPSVTPILATSTPTAAPPTATPTVTLTPTASALRLTFTLPANVRSGPSTFYPVLAGQDVGAQVEVIGRDAGAQWFVIAFAGAKDGRGWVSSTVASFTGNVNDLPVLTAPPPPPTPVPPTPPPAPKPVASAHGLTGELILCGGKTSYAVGERVCFTEKIFNTTAASINYGVLGVLAVNTSGGANQFQTSWSGDLSIGPGCYGPTDKCGGAWEDGMRLSAPGSYTLYLQICYSALSACQAGGDWESLTGGVAVTVN